MAVRGDVLDKDAWLAGGRLDIGFFKGSGLVGTEKHVIYSSFWITLGKENGKSVFCEEECLC